MYATRLALDELNQDSFSRIEETNPQFARGYMWSVVVAGWAMIVFSASRLPWSHLDLRFVALAVMVAISSQAAVRIPRVSGRVTLGDTFLFLTILLYGGEAAVLMSALEGVCATLQISRKPRTILLNSAVLAISTFLTATVLRVFFGSPTEIVTAANSANFLGAICTMALVQYFTNTSLIAVEKSYKINESVWQTWKKYYLWTSITCFAGASAAGIIAHLIQVFGFYAVLATVPIVGIVYFTYDIYLKNLQASDAQAALAQRHVEELSRYVADLRRSEEQRGQLLLREQRARADAEAANRMKDEFLATLSHELRTPLTALYGWACLLSETTLADDLARKAAKAIERNAKIQTQLIDDLLDVSGIISGKLHLDVRPMDLSAVTEAAISVVRPAADAKSIQLTYTHPKAVRAISGDFARLQQVIWNLLSNAVKFTPEGGRIEVRLNYSDTHAQLTVTDNGKGISKDFLPHVFDRFRQADSSTTRRFGGLGLGLAIVRHLVELHGGTVNADSEGVNLGATFTTSFPLIATRLESESLNHSSEHTSVDLLPLAGLRVLVVDDEMDARQLVSHFITRSGAEVQTCESSREALELLEQWRPDVLLSDIGMPGEDGYSFINKVRALPAERGGRTPAAAFTAYAREEDRDRALAAGYQMHIAKPVSSEDLVSTLAQLAATSFEISSSCVRPSSLVVTEGAGFRTHQS
ncbi:MAG TPA: ATP-binding protein [Pyrinomonadaceae bacterium]|nr:ATP-binding protein [Pyrinomonadaceae bacterium]